MKQLHYKVQQALLQGRAASRYYKVVAGNLLQSGSIITKYLCGDRTNGDSGLLIGLLMRLESGVVQYDEMAFRGLKPFKIHFFVTAHTIYDAFA